MKARNIFVMILAGILMLKNPAFWKIVFKFFFVTLFWEGLGATIIFLLMIPAMRSGDIPVWLAIVGSLVMGGFSSILSATYYYINPFKKINE